MIPLNWKLRLTRHSGVLVSQNQQAEKGLTVLAGVTDPKVGRLGCSSLCTGGEERHEGAGGLGLGPGEDDSSPIQAGPLMTRPSGNEALGQPQRTELQPAEGLAEGTGSPEQVVGEGSYKYRLQPHGRLQKPEMPLCYLFPPSAIVIVRSLSCVQLFATPWTAADQASLSFTISRSLLRLKSVESMMPSNCLTRCCPFSTCPCALSVTETNKLGVLSCVQWSPPPDTVVGKESAALPQVPSKESRQLMLKRPELPEDSQGEGRE